MKSNSTTRPNSLLKVSDSRYHYNYNIQEVTTDNGTAFNYEVVVIEGLPTYDKVVDARIRDMISAEVELSLINKYNDYQAGLSENVADRDNYLQFRQNVHAIKQEVRAVFNIN